MSSTFSSLFNIFRRYKSRYIIGIICLVIVDSMQLVIPRILGRVTDGLNAGIFDARDLLIYAAYIILIAGLIVVGRFFWRIYVFGTSRLIEYHLRNRFFTHLQTLPARFFYNHKTGDLMAHSTNDITAVQRAMGPGIVMIVDALFMTVATLFVVLQINVKLTLIALLPLPFLALVSTKFGQMIHRRFRKVQAAFSNLSDKVQENVSGIRVVKSFVQETAEIDKFRQANQHAVDMNMQLVRVWGLFGPLVQFISALSFLLLLGYGGLMVMYGDISLGDFIAFNAYIGLMTWPMMAVGFVINLLQRGMASMERLNEIFAVCPEITDASSVNEITEIEGAIEFRNLTFRYNKDNVPALRGINLKVNKGETLAVVGRTGSGKTTLVNLLLRVYDPEPGQILIDGRDIREIPLAVLRKEIGYVPQDNFLFTATVTQNIAFGVDDYTEDDVVSAAKTAQIYDNIVEFPRGFDTMVGERGVTLSGGQKQRISIARALIKDPKILILDDSLSAVDTETEEQILQGLKEIMAERTSIIIAHRISTVKSADQIIVLDDGQVIEHGNHESLLEERGLYYELYQKQLLEEKLEQVE